MSRNKADFQMLLTQSGIINQYKLAAQAAQRGFTRLHRKIDHYKNREAFLLKFIDDLQLTNTLRELEAAKRATQRIQYEESLNG